MSNSGVHTESRTEPFIWTPGVDCSNSFNLDRVQVLSYSKYSLLDLQVVGIEPVTSWWFQLEALSNQIYCTICLCQTHGTVVVVEDDINNNNTFVHNDRSK